MAGYEKRVLISQFSDFPYYDKIHLYAHDTLVKQGKFESAARYARLYNLDLTQEIEMDVPGGYLHKWLRRINLKERFEANNRTPETNAGATASMTLQHARLQDNTDHASTVE